jgi:transposase
VNTATKVTLAAQKYNTARENLQRAVVDAYPAMSARELAELAGVSHQTVLNWWKEKQQ